MDGRWRYWTSLTNTGVICPRQRPGTWLCLEINRKKSISNHHWSLASKNFLKLLSMIEFEIHAPYHNKPYSYMSKNSNNLEQVGEKMELFIKLFCLIPILVSIVAIIICLRSKNKEKDEQKLLWYKRKMAALLINFFVDVLFAIGCWFIFNNWFVEQLNSWAAIIWNTLIQ